MSDLHDGFYKLRNRPTIIAPERKTAAERLRFNNYAPVAGIDTENHVLYGVSAMQAVEALGHDLLIDRVTLREFRDLANAKPNGLKSRFTHPGLSSDGLGKFIGRAKNFRVAGDKLLADLHLSDIAARSPHGDLRAYIEGLALEAPDMFGLSVVLDGRRVWVLDDGTEVDADPWGDAPRNARDGIPTLRVVEAYAVDAVDEPAANRDGLFGAFSKTTNELAAATYADIDRHLARAGIDQETLAAYVNTYLYTGEIVDPAIRAYVEQVQSLYDFDDSKLRVFAAQYLEHRQRHSAQIERVSLATPQVAAVALSNDAVVNAASTGDRQMSDNFRTPDDAAVKATTAPAVAQAPVAEAQAAHEWLAAMQRTAAQAMIQSSGLPQPIQKRLLNRSFASPADVEAAITEERETLAALQEANVIFNNGNAPRGGGIHVSDPMDEVRGHVNYFFGAPGAVPPPANMRNFADLYVALTGDTEFHGVFRPDRVTLSGANLTTLPNLAVDAMNKIIVEQMRYMDHWRWYERIVSVEPNDGTLNDMKWITLGGIANLPTVSEGAPYTELNVADTKETSAFVKAGGYVGITREMIRNSAIQQMQAIPRALANAAIRSRSAAVSAIFTANSGTGPTLAQDSTVLFHINHGANVQATAFGTDATAWRAARAECFQHAEVGSGKPLGIYPRYALLPAELYDVALSVFGYGEGMPTAYSPEAQDRGFADPRPIPLTVPDWTDGTDWAYIVDPNVYPVIQMSYSQNPGGRTHPAPELFTAASETAGLMFTNDILPIKVRDEFAVGVNGWRGIGKRNVTGS